MVEWNKNISQIYELDGEKIVSKDYQKPIFLHRELFFYDLFEKNNLINIPKIHSFNKFNLKTYFIETEEKDILQTAKEWAKIHSYFMKDPVENKLLIPHNLQEVISYILENINLFENLEPIIKKGLCDFNLNQEQTTLLHGDLQNKNIVTSQGENYYFDFELGGLGHPGRDIASMIISTPDKKEEIIQIYRNNFSFDYPEIKGDIDTWLLARTAQLYVIFDKREGSMEQKKKIRKKLSTIIQNL